MITINKIEPQTCELYNPQGKLIDTLNEYEFHDIRVQIKEQKLNGYYCKFIINEKEVIFKTKTLSFPGRSNDWQDGIFDTIENLIIKLL